MIKVTLKSIENFGLPLDTTEKVLPKGTSEDVLRQLEKQYNKKSIDMCSKIEETYEIYANEEYRYIPSKDKARWVTNYEVYVRSSLTYKFWIAVYKFITVLE